MQYDPERVLAIANFADDLTYAIAPSGARYGNPYGEVQFAESADPDSLRFGVRFRTDTPGYLITADDIRAAIRGDVDSVEREMRYIGAGQYRRCVIAYVQMPRPHATPHQRGWATRRFNAWRASQEEHERRTRERNRERAMRERKADTKAWKTLFSFLSKEQVESLTKKGWFVITGSEGTRFRVYGAKHGSPSGNVWWLDKKEKRAGQLCAHCDTFSRGTPHALPIADHILTQVLEIVTDEKHWMEIAHHLNGEIHPQHRKKYSGEW
jgi:hypothetical protein